MLHFEKIESWLLFIAAFFCVVSCTGGNDDKPNEIGNSILLQEYAAYMDFTVRIEGEVIDNLSIQRYLMDNGMANEPVLVVYYSVNDCKVCLDSAIANICNFLGDIRDNKRILFVVSGAKPSFPQEYGNTIALRNDENIGLPFSDVSPLMFVYDKGIKHCFLPTSLFGVTIGVYLDSIRERYGI